MTPLFLLISIGLIWANLIGLGLVSNAIIRDYAVSRIAGLLFLCLGFFFLEHFHGMGPSLSFLPFSTALSGWLIWKDRKTVGRNWGFEAAFGVGLFYCLVWRFTFTDIGLFEESFPDLVFIHDYIVGAKLPPPDRWMPPFPADFYYSFQFYAAALVGRWFKLGPGLCYQLGYCLMSGLITCSVYAAVRRACAWRPAAWLVTGALLLGGCGLAVVIHLSMKSYLQPLEMARYLGMVWDPKYRTAFGRALDHMMYTPGVRPIEFPVEPLSYVLIKGEFHPPLMGYVILAFSFLVIFTLDGEESPRQRRLLHALLAATIPIALIGNTWVLPLQSALVLGWFAYRGICGERDHWLPGLFGAATATALAYPFLVNFLLQPSVHASSIGLTHPGDHVSLAAWLSVFWPVVVLMVLAPLNAQKRGLGTFLVCLWAFLLIFTEAFYNHDVNGATWVRFNSTLKWWGWIYAGGVLSLGAANLGARSRLCRYGSLAAVLLPCIQAYDYGRDFLEKPKESVGILDGTNWMTRDLAVRDIVSALKALPDGICLDSGVTFGNTDATVVAIFGNKQAFMGWPVQEGIWRLNRTEVRDRLAQVDAFYSGKMADPLAWLTDNNVRYVLWLQKDNDNLNARFLPLWAKIRSRYAWRHFAGNDGDWAVGFWERIDPPGPRR